MDWEAGCTACASEPESKMFTTRHLDVVGQPNSETEKVRCFREYRSRGDRRVVFSCIRLLMLKCYDQC
jgi:hypothetical protein